LGRRQQGNEQRFQLAEFDRTLAGMAGDRAAEHAQRHLGRQAGEGSGRKNGDAAAIWPLRQSALDDGLDRGIGAALPARQ
jgi:hypothetical protein